MKNVIGSGCPAWLQAQCIAEAVSQPSSGNPVEDQVLFDLYMSICIEKGNTSEAI